MPRGDAGVFRGHTDGAVVLSRSTGFSSTLLTAVRSGPRPRVQLSYRMLMKVPGGGVASVANLHAAGGSQDCALQEHAMRWNEAHKEDDSGQKHLPVSSE